ncbi:hypothetical protein FD33_GL002207 [Companilactobacillus paralimentarius DSM 13238 = JCM 10415]|uniref:Uncharacterized protein n=1 Tax=Companilactobacillus paralimentarius DSM 13238 = JCM 10415 TaxID=1122151 RepID=A0A0R1PN95_9LACO|nr:hypothetical protein [Companilactobacillus paralimentarius]KAE9564522.1 hypothetical protein ATN96_08155 [Companilactobacillus paralimentarius]KAE9564942.1 hypothetical protein ATN96_06025 [Companilactobacillus paralimentarius]KRL31226.1 hypothetical protein FD33_GL002207 [Companilactobacillus paralimentarius DSM 13238 = JCM 10415]QFR70115.1 hypothetical protein LP238_10450 [Companilactobacillus paralimentarius]
MANSIDPFDVEEIANQLNNDKMLLEILRDEIQVLDEQRASNTYTANEITNELERVTPRVLALCDILLNETNNNNSQLMKLVNDVIHGDDKND